MLPPDTLPPLTPHQEHILDYVIKTWTEPFKPLNPGATTLPAIARALNLSLAQLLAELNHPALAAHLAAIRDLSHLETTLHAAGARRIAVDVLTQIAADPETDPIERRRAATAFLRATGAPRKPRSSDSSPDATHGGAGILPARTEDEQELTADERSFDRPAADLRLHHAAAGALPPHSPQREEAGPHPRVPRVAALGALAVHAPPRIERDDHSLTPPPPNPTSPSPPPPLQTLEPTLINPGFR